MSDPRIRAVGIRWLAEFTHRRGDLYPYRGSEQMRLTTRADEGIATQRRIQRQRPAGYLVEHAVRQRVAVGDTAFELRGRVDGLALHGDSALVEEFKTTRMDAEVVYAHDGAVHWAQVRLYAALLCKEYPQVRRWDMRLLYCHPDREAVRTYERTAGQEELDRFLGETLARLWPEQQQRHERARNAWLAARSFPFPAYRPHQRAVARRCYRALGAREPLLIEAPTGSGKSLAVLYPALKGLAVRGTGQLLFLTSRGTGARAARSALGKIDPQRQTLRYLTITAKEKACIVEGMPCAAERCRYAKGYYEKRDAAVATLLAERAISGELVEAVARQHEVCPFELSLDAATRADVVICDYNYVFDPVVRLQRFLADSEIDLLVDEAHQLSGRAADMLSAGLDRHTYKAALAEPVGAAIKRRLRSIDRALTELRRHHGKNIETLIDQPRSLTRAISRLLEEVVGSPQPGSARGHPSHEKAQPGSARGHPSHEKAQPGSARGHPPHEKTQPGSASGHPPQEKTQPENTSGHPPYEKSPQPENARGHPQREETQPGSTMGHPPHEKTPPPENASGRRPQEEIFQPENAREHPKHEKAQPQNASEHPPQTGSPPPGAGGDTAHMAADLTRLPLLRAALFETSRWMRSEDWRLAGAFEYLLDTRGRGISVRSQCLDPSRHLRDTFARYRSSIRFSGTLSPLSLYNQLHGLDNAASERAASAFDERQLAVLLVRDINTYFHGREASVTQLAEAIHAVFSAGPGHCLVAFPSYGYLERFAAAVRTRFAGASLHCQVPGMTAAEQDAFLTTVRDSDQPLLVAVVLGGVFAESVDLSEVPLAGVIAVGAGVPPPSLARDRQRRYFDEKTGNGRQVAFLQPAMTRIVQAAGRLLRSLDQRGVICLIDPRFEYPEYRRFFPAHWRPRTLPAASLGKAVANFWEGSMLPRDAVHCDGKESER